MSLTFTDITINRTININELKELEALVEVQETTDRYTSTSLHIEGDFATIDVDIDDLGNVTLK